MMRTIYRYQVIRYVPDLERMEPRNIGLIVQGASAVAHRINGHFRPKRAEAPSFDIDVFRQWRDFFDHELNTPRSHEFVPEPTTVAYLEHLASRCTGNYRLTQPLIAEFPVDDLESVLDTLYGSLVAHTKPERPAATTPVRTFCEGIRSKRLVERYRGILRRDAYVEIGGCEQPWMYSYCNGHTVVIDKVELGPETRQTQLELGSLLARLRMIPGDQDVERIAVVDPPEAMQKGRSRELRTFSDTYRRGLDEIEQRASRMVIEQTGSERLVETVEGALVQAMQQKRSDRAVQLAGSH